MSKLISDEESKSRPSDPDRETWQIAETQRAVQEADAGDFAREEEVDAVISKWTDPVRFRMFIDWH